MPLYQVLDADGNVVRESTNQNDVAAPGLRDGETLHTVAELDIVPDRNLKTWDAATKTYVDRQDVTPTPIAETRLTVRQFRARFTDTERDRIELAQTEHPDALVRARLRRAEKELQSVQNQVCDRADRDLQRMVAWMTTVSLDGAPLIADMNRVIAIIGADAFNAANLA